MQPLQITVYYDGSIQFLEHVVAVMTLEVTGDERGKMRGDIVVDMTSPSGTVSTLLSQRPYDYGYGGYQDWPFMSVMFWGEDPTGEWTLTVSSLGSATVVRVSGVKMTFYGVSSTPEAVADIPDRCHSDCRRGCAGEGSHLCDSCVNLRNAYTLECINECPPGYTERSGYCYDPNLSSKECTSPLKFKEEGYLYQFPLIKLLSLVAYYRFMSGCWIHNMLH